MDTKQKVIESNILRNDDLEYTIVRSSKEKKFSYQLKYDFSLDYVTINLLSQKGIPYKLKHHFFGDLSPNLRISSETKDRDDLGMVCKTVAEIMNIRYHPDIRNGGVELYDNLFLPKVLTRNDLADYIYLYEAFFNNVQIEKVKDLKKDSNNHN